MKNRCIFCSEVYRKHASTGGNNKKKRHRIAAKPRLSEQPFWHIF